MALYIIRKLIPSNPVVVVVVVVVTGLLVVVGLGEEWNTWSRFLALFIALCCICYGKWVASMHRKDLLRALPSSITIIQPIIYSFCACPPMMQCLYDIDIDRQRSCARNDSRNRQHAPRGAPCLSFFCKIFIL